MTELCELKKALESLEAELMAFQIPDSPEMEEGLKRLIGAGGKRLRPSLSWICYDFGKEASLPILPLMCMLELMHTASLIHDDIVDDAKVRRGVITIQTESGKRMAAESGDYLLGLAMEYLKIYRGTGINEMLADVSEQMCIGELTEMQSFYSTEDQNEETFMIRIRQKTACLIAASCGCGALAGGLTPDEKEALQSYGEYIGTAFQLQDDLLDITADGSFGKQCGQDLRKGIFTLPVLHAFQSQPDAKMVCLAEKKEKNDQDIEILIRYITETKGIEYTKDKIREYTQKAVSCLAAVPEGNNKQMLIRMADALSQRTI